MRVGGRATWLLEPATPEELREAWLAVRERGLPLRLLGGGANLLIEDGLWPGAVISTDRLVRVFRPLPDVSEAEATFGAEVPATMPLDREADPRLVAWCGAGLLGLVRKTQELGWTGFEGLAGVPGSLGGGVAMNAGGHQGWVWDVVESVRVLSPEGDFVDLPRAECAPRYRDGGLGGAPVVGAVLRFEVDTPRAVRDRVRESLVRKRATQPVTEHSSGCIFRNPDPEQSAGASAGRLVEEAGCKGLTRGDATVSELHANFIVNRGHARASDVLGLIEEVRERVADRSGIRLQTEVVVWRLAEPGPDERGSVAAGAGSPGPPA